MPSTPNHFVTNAGFWVLAILVLHLGIAPAIRNPFALVLAKPGNFMCPGGLVSYGMSVALRLCQRLRPGTLAEGSLSLTGSSDGPTDEQTVRGNATTGAGGAEC